MKPTCVGLTSTKKVPLKNGSRLPLKFKLTLQEGAGSHTCIDVIMYFIVTLCMYVYNIVCGDITYECMYVLYLSMYVCMYVCV